MGKLMRATSSFYPDNRRVVGIGQTIDSDHPVVKNHPEFFEEVQPDIRWETATASPGPVRHVTPASEPLVVEETTGERIAREAEEALKNATPPVVEETPAVEPPKDLPPYVEIDPGKFSLTELKTMARREGVSDVGTTKDAIAQRINDKRAEKASGK